MHDNLLPICALEAAETQQKLVHTQSENDGHESTQLTFEPVSAVRFAQLLDHLIIHDVLAIG